MRVFVWWIGGVFFLVCSPHCQSPPRSLHFDEGIKKYVMFHWGFLELPASPDFFHDVFRGRWRFCRCLFVEKKGLCLGCFPYGSLTQIQRAFFGVTSKDVTRSKHTEKIRNQSLMSLRCLGLFFWCGGLFNIGRKEGLKIHGNLSSFFVDVVYEWHQPRKLWCFQHLSRLRYERHEKMTHDVSGSSIATVRNEG